MTRKTTFATIFCGILGVFLLITAASGTVAAQSEYELSTADSVDTPTREVTLRGATYEISALGRAERGGSVDLSINAPESNQFYRVYLYNSSQTPVIRESGTGDETITFNLNNEDPGTYMFALQEQGTTQVIHPLVIKAYDLDFETPEQVPADDSFTANISLTQTESGVTADRVEVVVAGQNSQLTETANQDDNSYSATISTDPLAEGSYLVYSNVRGTNTVYNEQEILGVSSTNTVTVGDDGSTDDGSTDDGSTDDGSTDDGSTDDGSTDDGSTDDESTDDGSEGDSMEPSGEIEDPEEREELPEDPEPDADDGSGGGTDETQSDSSSSIPGFTHEIAVIAVLLVTLMMRIHNR